jgi:hypothetical protein
VNHASSNIYNYVLTYSALNGVGRAGGSVTLAPPQPTTDLDYQNKGIRYDEYIGESYKI